MVVALARAPGARGWSQPPKHVCYIPDCSAIFICSSTHYGAAALQNFWVFNPLRFALLDPVLAGVIVLSKRIGKYKTFLEASNAARVAAASSGHTVVVSRLEEFWVAVVEIDPSQPQLKQPLPRRDSWVEVGDLEEYAEDGVCYVCGGFGMSPLGETCARCMGEGIK